MGISACTAPRMGALSATRHRCTRNSVK
jgi:hypothetical protein